MQVFDDSEKRIEAPMLTQLVSTMARLVHFISWFIFGCIISSLITWIVTLHPILWQISKIFFGFLICANSWGIVHLFYFSVKLSDDNKITIRGLMEASTHFARFMLFFVCLGIGVGVVLCF